MKITTEQINKFRSSDIEIQDLNRKTDWYAMFWNRKGLIKEKGIWSGENWLTWTQNLKH